jgi:hypothetical protein
VRKIPLLKPIQPKIRQRETIKTSIKFI